MSVTRNEKVIEGLPEYKDFDGSLFLVEHEDYGWLLTRWYRRHKVFIGVGHQTDVGLPITVVFQDDQVAKALRHYEIKDVE